MLTVQDWLDAGYKRYNNHMYKSADFLLQKRFDDEIGKKYFIDIWVYEHFNKVYFSNNPGLKPVSFQPEVQFQRGEDMTLDFTLHMKQDSDIADVEQQVEHLWVLLEKPYYEKWSEQ